MLNSDSSCRRCRLIAVADCGVSCRVIGRRVVLAGGADCSARTLTRSRVLASAVPSAAANALGVASRAIDASKAAGSSARRGRRLRKVRDMMGSKH